MRRYWDLSNEERAALSREDVEALCRVEAMEKGVTKPPIVEEVSEEPPEMRTRTLFRPNYHNEYGSTSACDVAFETKEQLDAFVALRPVHVERAWEIECNIAHPISAEAEVVTIANDAASALEARKAWSKAKRVAAEQKQKYEKEKRAYDEAVESVWSDWREQGRHAFEVERAREKWTEYVGMCDGNERIALGFFLKIHSDGEFVAEVLGVEKHKALTQPIENPTESVSAS